MVEVTELVRKKTTPMSQEKRDDAVKKLRKEHDKMVHGMFEFLDAGGGFLEFSYRFFPGEPIQTIKIKHGEICDLPLGIVKHLNNTMKKVRTMSPNLDVKTGTSTYEKTSRVRFTPLEVM